jgi:hypothetical protein
MTSLKKGDRVDCLIRSGIIVGAYEPIYDDVKTFEIIGLDGFGYYLSNKAENPCL